MMPTSPDLPSERARGASLAISLTIGIGLFLTYIANGREIGAGDTVPAKLLALAICRGDGPFLDRFDSVLRTPEGRVPGWAQEARGHVLSRYPVGPALLAAPFVWPQCVVHDLASSGEDLASPDVRYFRARTAKLAAAAIMALAFALLYHVLCGLGLERMALPAVLIAALGSDCWAVASQSLWQHGPAVLCLTAAVLLLHPRHPSRLRFALAGLALALLVACRPLDVVFAAICAIWVTAHFPRRNRLAFFTPAMIAAFALSAYNVWYFGSLNGGYAQVEAQHLSMHGVKGSWTGSFWMGAAGTLFSPSHGLFVFSPWIAVALVILPVSGRFLERRSLALWLLWGLVPYFILLSKYSCWWGGWSFGPRFWIDATPQFTIALAVGLQWAWTRCRILLIPLAAAVAAAVAIQLIGVVCFPSSWQMNPTNADRRHERLWDWRDSELTRCLREGPAPSSGSGERGASAP
jgi:hypothetical protein